MTSVFFVRHAQPDSSWRDDRTRPLTALGLEERTKVTELLLKKQIDVFISSPYKRSVDTISECAKAFKTEIRTDERFRERQAGEVGAYEQLERRWRNFDFCEPGGETLGMVQRRNVEAHREVLIMYKDKKIVIGTHGTALSTIINSYDPSFTCEGFKDIWHCMPYVVRLDFDDQTYMGREELLRVQSFY